MPCLTTWVHSCSAVVLPMWTMSSPKRVQKQSHSCSCQGCKATNHTGTLLNLPKHWNSPRNPPEPSRSCLRNLHQHTLEPSGTFRKLPTSTHRNPPEPSGTCLRNLHQHTSELSGTCLRNLHQPGTYTPAHTGTLRNLLEPSSGTCSSDSRQHTPELIWAEDPIPVFIFILSSTYCKR